VIAAGILTTKILKVRWVDVLNDYAFNIAVPALLIISFWRYELRGAEVDFIPLTYLSLLFCSLLSYGVFKFLKVRDITILVMSSVLGNVAYLGIPLVELTFGKEYLSLVGLLSVTHFSILPIFTTIMEGKLSYKTLKSPLIIATVIGLSLSLVDIPINNFIFKSLDLIASSASPVALFSIGMWIGSKGFNLGKRETYFVIIFKLIILPIIFNLFYLSGLFSMDDDIYKVSLLEASTPLAIANFIIAKKFNKHVDTVSSAIVISTLISPITLSIFLSL